MGRGLTPKQCSEEILAFFNDIESTVCFVQNEAVVAQVARSILTKLDSHSPHVFVISGSASAMVKCRQIKCKVLSQTQEYSDTLVRVAGVLEVYFLTKKMTIKL